MNPTELIPRAVALRAAIASNHLEGRSLHPQDLKILEAWAHHELSLTQALEQLHELLGEASSTLSPEERYTRIRSAFPTLREAELQCYGMQVPSVPTPDEPPPKTAPAEEAADLNLAPEQSAQLDEDILASAWALANDPECLARTRRLLF